ncbi:MAG: hypothetical protein AB7Q81_03875 [Gammaproteobacteria bacterium]
MASFRDILLADDSGLVRIFYKVRAGSESDFIKKINHAAAQIGVNHSQLVCALGFNRYIRDLTDILELLGFSSYKLLTYRRNELFSTDCYRQLDIDNVIDIYAAQLADSELESHLLELVPQRLAHIEARLEETLDPAMLISYKMEVHSIYSAGIATAEFAAARVAAPIADLRLKVEEVAMIVDGGLIPAGNLFYSDTLLPAEKRYLVERGLVDTAMIRNRLGNADISEDERQMLEDFL